MEPGVELEPLVSALVRRSNSKQTTCDAHQVETLNRQNDPRPVVLLALLAASACGRTDAGDPGSASTLLEGVDVFRVGSIDEVPTLGWNVAETPSLRVGGSGRGQAHEFAEVSAATMLPGGVVLVADGRSGLVRLYGPGGGFQRQLGLPGEDPGEFRSPRSSTSKALPSTVTSGYRVPLKVIITCRGRVSVPASVVMVIVMMRVIVPALATLDAFLWA